MQIFVMPVTLGEDDTFTLLTELQPWFLQFKNMRRLVLACSGSMIEEDRMFRDLAALTVPVADGLIGTWDRYEPYRLIDVDGMAVQPLLSSSGIF